MAAEKTISISFRITPKFKALLEIAAQQENRSFTNMMETLLFTHCGQHGLKPTAAKVSKPKGVTNV